MTNFKTALENFQVLAETSRKFPGFVIPEGVVEKVEVAASKIQEDLGGEAAALLVVAHKSLAAALRGFLNNSPVHFRKEVAKVRLALLPDYADRLLRAVDRYAVDVKAMGWQEAVGAYNALGLLITRAPVASKKIAAQRAAAAAAERQQKAAAEATAQKARQVAEQVAAADRRRAAAGNLLRLVRAA